MNSWVLVVVEKGHSLEFTTPLTVLTFHIKWTILLDSAKAKVLQEILDLLQKDAIEEVDPLSKGLYSTFFVVPKKDGGFRPILNLKPFNHYIIHKSFKMETATTVLSYLSQGDWLASLDLKDAYLHVPILPTHRPYLRFAFQGKSFRPRYII